MRRLSFALLVLAFATDAFAQYDDAITVSRLLVDVRVTRAGGEPIRDLTASDFTVRIGGRQVEVASARWIDESGAAVVAPGATTATDDTFSRDRQVEEAAPRTVIVFIQTDFQRASVRVRGQMKFRTYAEKLVQSFGARDRVAVFSFDSYLKFRCDLTGDKEAVIRAMRESILIDHPPPPPAVPEPSLAPLLDRAEMKRAANSENALGLLAKALQQIDGPKTLLLLGWGLGDRVGPMVMMKRQWPRVRRALEEARVAILSLDTTDAYHDLAAGLSIAAAETGGLYAAAAISPHLTLARVQRTLEGRYELEIIPPAELRGDYALDVRVNRRGAIVLAPTVATFSLQ